MSVVLPPQLFHVQPLGARHGVVHLRGVWDGAPVFVKALNSADRSVRARFVQEAEVNANISRWPPHPNLLRLVARTRSTLVFPFLGGGTLDAWTHRPGAVGPAQALRLFSDLLCGVDALHRGGVVHQDLKPENVLLSISGRPVLTDFGMAYDVQARRDVHEGTRMGTPQFMAPEQFRGVRGDVRSDVYSLGCLLWTLLHGEPPDADPFLWLASGLGRPAGGLPLSGVPHGLGPLLAGCLEREPDARPQSVPALQAALRDWASGRKISAAVRR